MDFYADNFDALVLSRDMFGKDIMDSAKFPSDIEEVMKACADAFRRGQERMVVVWSAALSTVECLIDQTKCKMAADQFLILQAVLAGNSSVEDISAATGINLESVKDNLMVLQRAEAGKIIESEADVYVINPQYKFKGQEVQFPGIQAALAEKEKAAVESNVEIARMHSVQCAIVQKLKAFRHLEVLQLYSMVQKSLKFALDTKLFTAQLRELETKGLIEREKNNDKVYNYLP
jgi:hypothetical protein